DATPADKIPILTSILNEPKNRYGSTAAALKERAVYALARAYCEDNRHDAVVTLLTGETCAPFFANITKAKTAKVVRAVLDSVCALAPEELDMQAQICQNIIAWCRAEKRSFLRQRVEAKMASVLFQQDKYGEALTLVDRLLVELKKLDDKQLLVEVHLVESKIHHGLRGMAKSKAALTASRTSANAIYVAPSLQSQIDMMSGVLHCEEGDYDTAHSYFLEAFEQLDQLDDREKAVPCLKYMMLCKILDGLNKALGLSAATGVAGIRSDHKNEADISGMITGKRGVKYAGRNVDAMSSIAAAASKRSLKEYEAVLTEYSHELQDDLLIKHHLNMPLPVVEKKLSQMILDGKFHGILDQGKGQLIVYEEADQDQAMEKGLKVIENMDKVVTSLFGPLHAVDLTKVHSHTTMSAANNSNESYCTFTLASDVTAGGLPSEEEIAKQLESNDPKIKRHALKAAIMAMLGGEALPRILMQVIRFCINSDDKPLKKLCMLYWEVVPKYQEPTSDEVLRAASGGQSVQRKLLPEMILVCNALMNDLNHPNEYVRGSMLRFLCKVKDEEILGPLIPSIKACLQHRHQYVRKNAAMAVFHAHRLHGETLIPDGPELMDAFISAETDIGARRNAFLMLYNESEELAIQFLAKNLDDVVKFGDGFALLVLDLTRKACRRDPNQKSRFVRVLFQMLSAESPAVEVSKTTQESSDSSEEKGKVYRNMLIQAIHGCAVRFPDVAESVVHTLMDFLSSDGGMQVIIFVRAIVEKYPDLRPAILTKLINTVDEVTNTNVMCICLWILGEYCETSETVKDAYDTITEQLGEAPFIVQAKDKKAREEAAAAAAKGPELVTKNVVLADGTYATQTVYSEPKVNTALDNTPNLRKMIVGGDIFLGSVVSSCLTKMCLRGADVGLDALTVKSMTVNSLLTMCGIVKMAEVTSVQGKEGKTKEESKDDVMSTQADDLIHFRQLKSLTAQAGDLDLDDGSDLARATGYADGNSLLTNELSHVYQLSGFADPVYAEAFVTVHDYDILLDILVINRTPNTLANLTVELSTMGDMKIVERPQSHTIGPLDQINIRASIKVSSTETGHIFGTIVYEDASTQEKGYINMNDIHMDIMDYIRPATCTDEVFRSMWAEFEWENKVAITTSITDLIEFLDHIVSSTNMKSLTPFDRDENGSFLAANLYAKSVFGEDALVNVSVEKKDGNDGKLAGYIRIRSKTQGIALSLGDRITSVQRGLPPKSNVRCVAFARMTA
ncbi:coatomer subunit beta, partial [Skeletonema marinoi]